jgi:hypothetical protein
MARQVKASQKSKLLKQPPLTSVVFCWISRAKFLSLQLESVPWKSTKIRCFVVSAFLKMLFQSAHSQLMLAYRTATQKQKAGWKGRGDSQTDGVS